MGVYVEVKLHDGTILGTMEIRRVETEVESPDPGMCLDSYHYSYSVSGFDPVMKTPWRYKGTVEHPRHEWIWALIGRVLQDKDWE